MNKFMTISDVARLTGISATALRFYDKHGLLFFVNRGTNGIRIFTESDVEKILLIRYLRELDMPVNQIFCNGCL